MKPFHIFSILASLCLAFFLVLYGCSSDKSPMLPVDIQLISVDKLPHTIAKGFKDNQYLVSCFGSGSVVAFSPDDPEFRKQYLVSKGPSHMVRDQSNRRIYCMHTQDNSIAVLGGEPMRVKKNLRTGTMTLAGAQMRPGTNHLWICDGVSGVNVLVVPSIQLKQKIQLGRYPQQVVFSSDGKTAYVTLKGENAVAVVDVAAGEKTGTIEAGIYPRDLVLVGNTLCVSNYGSHDVSLIDVTKKKEITRIPVRKKPNHLAVHKKTLWVSCEKSYRLVAIDVTKQKVIGTIKTGFYPGDVMALKDGSLIVAAPKKGKVAIIRPQPMEDSK